MGWFGGDGGGDTVDKAYNARMANIAEQAAGWADEFNNYYKYGVMYDPNETVQGYYDDSDENEE